MFESCSTPENNKKTQQQNTTKQKKMEMLIETDISMQFYLRFKNS